jgi:anthranilate synthase component 1
MLRCELAGRRDLLALAHRAPSRYPCLLESAATGTASARYDILFASTGEAIVADRSGAAPFLQQLDAAWRALRVPRTTHDLPFRGGWAVLLGYELAGECEPRLRLPKAPDDLPRAVALRCPAGAVYDHERDITTVFAEPDHAELFAQLHSDLDASAASVSPARVAAEIIEDDPARFLDGVARIHEYLRAGDVFQVNLSRAWHTEIDAALQPAALYAALRLANPAPFAGLWQWGEHAVLSSSPERLVQAQGERVQTRPIAGTRPRGTDDAARMRELLAHPKERAEHIMLIDLERNDLGRVCRPGTVVVDELMTVESYTHVHHIVSNVSGVLRADIPPGQILRAVFPGGTITGCPKVRCMEIVAELEGVGRGPYTGALGYLNRDGDMDFNILIRTIWIAPQGGQRLARWRAGSGIVVDSVAERELAETRHKARGLVRAMSGAF